MNTEIIKKGLTKFNSDEVDSFVNYLTRLATEKKRSGEIKNPWVNQRPDAYLINCFKQVNGDGLSFDVQHITVQPTGIS